MSHRFFPAGRFAMLVLATSILFPTSLRLVAGWLCQWERHLEDQMQLCTVTKLLGIGENSPAG